MAGNIVTAAVGGSAGGNVIPEPRDPGYATWPSFIQKTAEDVLAIYKDSRTNPQNNQVRSDKLAPGAESPRVVSAIFSRDTFILIAIVFLAFVGFRFMKG